MIGSGGLLAGIALSASKRCSVDEQPIDEPSKFSHQGGAPPWKRTNRSLPPATRPATPQCLARRLIDGEGERGIENREGTGKGTGKGKGKGERRGQWRWKQQRNSELHEELLTDCSLRVSRLRLVFYRSSSSSTPLFRIISICWVAMEIPWAWCQTATGDRCDGRMVNKSESCFTNHHSSLGCFGPNLMALIRWFNSGDCIFLTCYHSSHSISFTFILKYLVLFLYTYVYIY